MVEWHGASRAIVPDGRNAQRPTSLVISLAASAGVSLLTQTT